MHSLGSILCFRHKRFDFSWGHYHFSYQKILNEIVIPELKRRKILEKAIFQQNCARSRTSDASLLFLRKTFKDRFILNRFPNLFKADWFRPAYIPDLNPCDFLSWGYLKNRIHHGQPHTIEELKVTIQKEMISISRGMLQLV